MKRTRRKILLALAGASAFPSLENFAFAEFLTEVSKVAPEVHSTLNLCCPNLGDARRLGQLYLQQQPHEATVAVLQSRLWSDKESGDSQLHDSNLAIIRTRQVLKRHLRDCAETRMITINGIMLTRTEARLYGLGYLLT